MRVHVLLKLLNDFGEKRSKKMRGLPSLINSIIQDTNVNYCIKNVSHAINSHVITGKKHVLIRQFTCCWCTAFVL